MQIVGDWTRPLRNVNEKDPYDRLPGSCVAADFGIPVGRLLAPERRSYRCTRLRYVLGTVSLVLPRR
jgi:hypothetical protein